MSWRPARNPTLGDAWYCDAIEQLMIVRARDFDGFAVRRALPAVGRHMVGPFIFLDQVGPSEFLPGTGLDMRPHPHIGLAAVTYLFDGEIVHRDSLGTEMLIRPGELNLMIAGRGIVHSERTSPGVRAKGSRMFGIQAWAALPKAHEEMLPIFNHYDAGALPLIRGEGKTVRLVIGSLYGHSSPTEFPHTCFFAEAALAPGAVLPIDSDFEERAVYVISGAIDIAGDTFTGGSLLVFRPGDRMSILALTDVRLMLLGGEPMDGPRHIWWNFVSSSSDRIEAAKADWKAKRFASIANDAEEYIPLPP
jgi:redox-sensitive bicupin YhaK (pirin superfamily)